MTAKDRANRDRAIREAMASLVADERFTQFIEIIRDQRDVVVEDLCREGTLASDRLTLAAAGELRAYKSIIQIHDEFIAARAEAADMHLGESPEQA